MSREKILKTLRSTSAPTDPGLPELSELATMGMRIDDPAAGFEAVLTKVGGAFVRAESDAHALQTIETLVANLPTHGAGCFCSSQDLQCAGVAAWQGEIREATGQGKDLIELFAARGQVGVAENAAIWIAGNVNDQRPLYFLAEHLVLLIDRSALVATMHEAYAQIAARHGGVGTLGQAYGLFISGPSKTADIEQSLVIGAQGPRRLTVILVG